RQGPVWNVKSGDKTSKADDTAITSLLADFTPLVAEKYVPTAAEIGGGGTDTRGTPDVTLTISAIETAEPATAPATASAPASQSAALAGNSVGPMPARPITRTLKLYKPKANTTAWTATWDGGKEPWPFEPNPELV